jgi:hypothetical protein
MYKIPASLRSDSSECRFARIECHFVSESVAISSEYTLGNVKMKFVRAFSIEEMRKMV